MSISNERLYRWVMHCIHGDSACLVSYRHSGTGQEDERSNISLSRGAVVLFLRSSAYRYVSCNQHELGVVSSMEKRRNSKCAYPLMVYYLRCFAKDKRVPESSRGESWVYLSKLPALRILCYCFLWGQRTFPRAELGPIYRSRYYGKEPRSRVHAVLAGTL